MNMSLNDKFMQTVTWRLFQGERQILHDHVREADQQEDQVEHSQSHQEIVEVASKNLLREEKDSSSVGEDPNDSEDGQEVST